MTGDPGVVVLLQNPTAEVFVPRDDNLTAEVEQTGVDMPFGRAGGAGAPDLEDLSGCECNRVLEVRFTSEGLADVAEHWGLWTGDSNTL